MVLHDLLLEKYRESADEDDMSDVEVSKLSYSRFSQLASSSEGGSGSVGVIWNEQNAPRSIKSFPGIQQNHDSIRTSSSSSSISNGLGSSQNKFKPSNSTSFSPFTKKIQSKVQNIEYYGSKSATKPSMSLISEDVIRRNDKGESPFIDHPHKIDRHKSLLYGKTRHQSSDRQRANQKPISASSKIKNVESTPGKTRSTSVKISLTPAQRFEKRPGARSSNVLENFQFGTMVGKGAFASVYKGINLRTKQVVAIKQILLEPDQNVAELMGEIDLLKILKHPNIVKYHGFVKTSTSLNVFLEFCSGGSLRQLYKRLGHGLPEQQIIQYAKAVLQGLEYLHDQGVVHRDVKAANVLIIEETNDIKLADFGVATKVTNQYESVVGTPNWMAPETVLGGEGICTASDIWSFGATIIELFTTHPPYHELNPMATLHAIGTDDHPPLPKNISQLAQSFLLECFQKQPNLRKSARLLLKHKWIQGENKNSSDRSSPPRIVKKNDITSFGNYSEPSLHKSITSYSENGEENWEEGFDMKGSLLQIPKNFQNENQISKLRTLQATKLSKSDLLSKFSDKQGEEDVEDVSEAVENGISTGHALITPNFDDEVDPFLELDNNSFDTNELENQSKMDYLLSKFSKRVELCHKDNEDVHFTSLTKISGKMLHLVKKYPILHDVLVREHGILTILELLENAHENPSHQKLWFYCLSILNYLFQANVIQFENFCILGGIPMVTNFKNNITFNKEVRLQVVQFIQLFNSSDKALSMFISSGGLRILSKFVEEDFDSNPEFSSVSIHLIHKILSKDLTRSKSDLCRILSKHGVGFWLAVVLNRLTKAQKHSDTILELIDNIVQIFKYFGQSEAKVRINIANTDLFKLLIRLFDKLPTFDHQLTILKFLKSMSCVSEILRPLYNADILEFLVGLLSQYEPSKNSHYKEVINIVCPILYNCCYLNHTKEAEIVKLGVLPYLKTLSKINLPFRQFVLPLLCEFVYCDSHVRMQLLKHDVLSIYFNLIIDPYWQSNALDSILSWYNQMDKLPIKQALILETPSHIDCFVSGFLLPKVSNLESTLDSYLKFLNIESRVQSLMFKESVIDNIKSKLLLYSKNSVILLLLLRILRVFISYGSQEDVSVESKRVFATVIKSGLRETIENLQLGSGSVLIDELTNEIITIIELSEVERSSNLKLLSKVSSMELGKGIVQSIDFEELK